MHRFPPSEQFDVLIGGEIEQVCLDPYSTQFHLSGGVHITWEGAFEHVDAEGRRHVHQGGEERDAGPVYLRQILYDQVVAVEAEPLQLTLRFGSGASLRLIGDESPYESGQIGLPGEGLIVV